MLDSRGTLVEVLKGETRTARYVAAVAKAKEHPAGAGFSATGIAWF